MVRLGDDLILLLLEVLPRLPEGVIVGFSPVFSTFEYPWQWLWTYRLPWNDLDFLAAFLWGNER
ncbi:hypothetical protein [Candidatus Methylacidithermus pantelleriae]|uniref:Uncharacterized protein n=1 Tax=Candidatus Methylacidithermus pantelleriae TaxID=2744239 RepID=A0A8J2BQY3_9BACT|nr:hypothetical protein [Candidatus Methylacidithermus pantelleriae]CAF0700260.1 hypothetical protein MPNT_340021 [Candidatus Methylacidithermus pantelleriae]